VVDTLDYEKYLYSVIYLTAEIAAQRKQRTGGV